MSTPLMTASDASTPAELRSVKALAFDIIGTCTDWHSVVSACLQAHAPSNIPSTSSPSASDTASAVDTWASEFAHNWRSSFFNLLFDLNERQQMMSGADVYRITLKQTMEKFQVGEAEWSEEVINHLIKSWETASGMEFDAILNSDVIGAYKPNPKMYQTALKALAAGEGDVAMVAAHAYDLEAARKYGFKAIYIRRATEDIELDDAAIASKGFDLVINEGGLVELARRLGCEV
ncbi:hypothetical protein FRB90_006975 [Tulasnella sp. 427]|nr:hypothetical protein FRB90_006975 [Tulasnella sp. 427]